MQETEVQSLGQEDPLQKEMATHSSILPWYIPWTEEPGGLQSMGSQESDTIWWLSHQHHVCWLSRTREPPVTERRWSGRRAVRGQTVKKSGVLMGEFGRWVSHCHSILPRDRVLYRWQGQSTLAAQPQLGALSVETPRVVPPCWVIIFAWQLDFL